MPLIDPTNYSVTTASTSNIIYLNSTSATTTTGWVTNDSGWNVNFTPIPPLIDPEPPQLWLFDDPEWTEDACS